SARVDQEGPRLEELPALRNEREQIQQALSLVVTELEEKEKELEAILREAQLVTQKLEEFEQQTQHFRKELKQLSQKKDKGVQEYEECQKLLNDSAQIQNSYLELQKEEEALEEMRKKADQLHQVREAKRPHEMAWEQKKQQLLTQYQTLALEEKKILKKQEDSLKLDSQQASLESKLQPLKMQQDALKQEIISLQETQVKLKGIETQQQHLVVTQEKLQQRIAPLKSSSQGQCPLCEQTLSEEYRNRVLEQLLTEQKQEQQQLQSLKSEIWSLTQKHSFTEFSLPSALKIIEEKLKGQQQKLYLLEEQQKKGLQQVLSLDEKKKTLLEAITEWENTQKEIWDQSKKRQESHTIDPELARVLKEFEAQEAKIGYSLEKRTALQKKIESLASVKSLYLKLQQAQSMYQHRAEQLQEVQEEFQEKERLLQKLREQQEEWKTQHPFNRKNLEDKKADVSSRKTNERSLQEKLGGVKQKIVDLEQLQGALAESIKTLSTQRLLLTRLECLETACSRKGVQALLIEQAIPEIENDANQILTRLTQGEMQILFKTQKTLKNREEQVETLEIEIVDTSGERPYENFSGGEQFRINFAIRLALSKMLARRAGAELQMLVVDEGFGSQDPQGVQNIIEAIHVIQDEFACILVITHMEDLREHFPVQIWVEKGAQGSMISIR
ncbi:MAG: SMC family ATPase, partial [Planctomycetota bacterium]